MEGDRTDEHRHTDQAGVLHIYTISDPRLQEDHRIPPSATSNPRLQDGLGISNPRLQDDPMITPPRKVSPEKRQLKRAFSESEGSMIDFTDSFPMKKHDSAPHIVIPERKFHSIRDVFKLYKAKVGFLHGFNEASEQEEEEAEDEDSQYTSEEEDTGSYVNAESLEVPQLDGAHQGVHPYNAQWQTGGLGSYYYPYRYPTSLPYQGKCKITASCLGSFH